MTLSQQAVLEIRGLAKYYHRAGKRIAAVEHIDLLTFPASFKLIRGPSGSGKTTLLLAAGGLLRPDAGTVKVNGRDLYSLTPGERTVFRGRSIGFVFQQFHLIPFLSVLENVKLPGLALEIPDLAHHAAELLERFGLAPRLDHFPSELSTGERQRVALARALVASPLILLADEPTGNLDAENERIILDSLRDFAGRGGCVIMATHGLRVDGLADAAMLQEGRMQPRQQQN